MAMGINLDEPIHPGGPNKPMSRRARRRFFRWLGDRAAKAGRKTRNKVAQTILDATEQSRPQGEGPRTRQGEGG